MFGPLVERPLVVALHHLCTRGSTRRICDSNNSGLEFVPVRTSACATSWVIHYMDKKTKISGYEGPRAGRYIGAS
jgi:hypothetical protein